MDRETLKVHLIQSGINSNQLESILDNVDKYNLYDEFTDIGTRPPKDRVGYVYAKIKTKQRELTNQTNTLSPTQQHKNITANYIDKSMLPHVRVAMDVSNKQLDSGEGYEFPCAIKAFCIEYMLKCIEILVNADDVYATGNRSIEKLVDSFLKESKKRLANESNGGNYSGHEINDILNTLMPEHIKVLIKYDAILNHIDPSIKEDGTLVEPIKPGESKDSLIVHYFLMSLGIDESEKQSMNDIASSHNSGYQKNNKAFMTLRYLGEKASKDDYELLNCLMVSTYMTLGLLLSATQLADRFENQGTIPYECVKTLLSKEEYDELLATSAEKSFNPNNLITYHAFLKHFLKDKTPKFNRERYLNVNDLLSAVNITTSNTTGTSLLPVLYQKINMANLNNAGLKELSAFAPEFVFNSLEHNDKMIFKLCQEKGVTFELYYKLEPALFKKMVTDYGDLFQGQTIDIRLLIKRPAETLGILEVIKKHHPNCAIPKYYFDYNANEIEQAYQNCGIQNGLIDPDDLDITKTVLKVVTKFDINPNEPITNQEQVEEMISMMAFFVRMMTHIKRNNIEKQNDFKVKASEGIGKGVITKDNCESFGLSQPDFLCISILKRMADEYKTDSISPLLDIVQNIQIANVNGSTYFKPRTSEVGDREIIQTGEPRKTTLEEIAKEPNTNMVLSKTDKAIKNMLKSSGPLVEGMCFLREDEVLESYSYISELLEEMSEEESSSKQELNPDKYLFFKKPKDVKTIVDMYRQYASYTDEEERIPFKGELLFFDIDTLKDNFSDILDRIHDKHCYGEDFTIDHAKTLIEKRYSKKKTKKGHDGDTIKPTMYYSENPGIPTNVALTNIPETVYLGNPEAFTGRKDIPEGVTAQSYPLEMKDNYSLEEIFGNSNFPLSPKGPYIPPTTDSSNSRPRLH